MRDTASAVVLFSNVPASVSEPALTCTSWRFPQDVALQPAAHKIVCSFPRAAPSRMYEAVLLFGRRHVVLLHGDAHRGVDRVWQPTQTAQDHDKHQDDLTLPRPNRREGRGLILEAEGETTCAIGGSNLEENLEECEVAVDSVTVGRNILG